MYVPDDTSPLATTADVIITVEDLVGFSRPVLTDLAVGATVRTWAPRQETHSVADGTTLLYAGAGEPVTDRIPVVKGDRIKVVIANGGNALSGTFHITVA